MSSVGSLGVADATDLAQLVFNGSVVQLGLDAPTVVQAPTSAPVASARVVVPQRRATVRYSVTIGASSLSLLALQVCFRAGNGQVDATFKGVKLPSGISTVAAISETSLIHFNSNLTGDTADFHTAKIQGSPTGPNLDFDLYFIEVILTRPETVSIEGFAPAVAAVQVG
jgi:hypothetical protein